MGSTSIVNKHFLTYFILTLHLLFSFTSAEQRRGDYGEVLAVACKATSYEQLCLQSLRPFTRVHNPTPYLWARGGIVVTIEGLKAVSSTLATMRRSGKLARRELYAVTKCFEVTNSAAHGLQEALYVIRRLNSSHFERQMTYIQAWIKMAIRNTDMCRKEVKGVGRRVEDMVINASHLTHNALGLSDSLAISGQFG